MKTAFRFVSALLLFAVLRAPAQPSPTPTNPPTPTPSVSENASENSPLRDLTASPSATTETAVDQNSEQDKIAPTPPNAPAAAAPEKSPKPPSEDGSEEAVVRVLGNAEAFRPVREAVVAILGNSHAHEDVHEAVVAILGNATADKSVGEAVVAVLGNAEVNGEVYGDVVAVLGNVHLGPNAHVHGNAVSVGGEVVRSPGAELDGHIEHSSVGIGGLLVGDFPVALRETILRGRLLSFSAVTKMFWFVALAFLALYLAIAGLFPSAVLKTAQTLEERPGRTIGVALLAVIATPFFGLILLVTSWTIVLPCFLIALYVGASLFGHAALLAWLGRRVWRQPGAVGAMGAVAIGGIIVLLMYTLPGLGILTWKVIGTLGFGMAIYTAILYLHRPKNPPPANASLAPVTPIPVASTLPAAATGAPVAMASGVAAAPVATGIPAASVPATSLPISGAGAPGPEPAAVPVTAAPVVPPPILPRVTPTVSYATYPRAGFWIRVAASLLDFVAVTIAAAMLHLSGLLILLYTAYCVTLWALKGTTLGGIICGLKVVRLDDRPMDWAIAIVRALGAFLSAAICFIGFIWVAVDDERQSWHDKIAGTTIVHVPKGTPLL